MQTSASFIYKTSPVNSARLGTLSTAHGILDTPNFIFCGTKASIKTLPAHHAYNAGAEIILANTYHLMLNPGAEHIQARGGLHKFMNWNYPMLTDSGGYQIFAMGHGSVSSEIKKGQTRTLPNSVLSISEDEVVFKSYLNGSKVSLSPEKATRIQHMLGADLIMQFDECTPFHVDKQYTANSMRRSIRWGDRCIKELYKIQQSKPRQQPDNQAMYGIVQGGIHKDLRKESIAKISEQSFWGNAIGGSLGSERTEMHDVVAFTADLLLRQRAVHLLGIGDIPDIFWGVRQGIDTFDCVHPTRIARHATAIVPASIAPNLKLNLKNSRYATEDMPIDPLCNQDCCTQYTRAYIHHLFKAKELLGMYLLTLHNVAQMARLMREIRQSLALCIEENSTNAFRALEKFWLG